MDGASYLQPLTMTERGPQHTVTVREALRLPAVARGRPEVVAGADHLDRAIRWAHSGEVSNIAELLKGGELLLTTGLGIGDRPALQRRFVQALARTSAAAVVLELGQTFRRPPAALVEAAEDQSLPLIVMRREVRFVEITEAIHRAIVGRQLDLLRRGDEIHRRFTSLLIEGAGVREVLEALATEIGRPVLLERDGDIVSQATHDADVAAALAGWQTSRAIALPVPSAHGASWGTLIVPTVGAELDDHARNAAERAVGVLAVALLRHREEHLLVLGQQGRFLAEVASGALDARAAQLEADALGFATDAGWLLPLVLAPRAGTRASSIGWTAFCQALRTDLVSRRFVVLAGPDDSMLETSAALVVVSLDAPERRESAVEQVARAARAAGATELSAPGDVILAAGAPVLAWSAMGEALQAAAAAAALADGEPARPWYDATVPDLRHLVWRLRDDATVRTFAAQRLAPVLHHDAKRPSAALLPTLQALSANGWRKAEAARALHLERQSIYPRIGRLERLLTSDLGDPRQQGALTVALLAHELGSRGRDH